MAVAAVTFVYNESFNLSLWIGYYGKLFGRENLFVVDRGSDDGSTADLPGVNLIRVPRRAFDEHEKTDFMSSFHASLTSFYDAVIITDCDEIIVPDPADYADLSQYIERLPGDYVNALGIDVLHLITEELPLDPARGILSQRKYGRFLSPECKQLISRVPVRWLPGLHCTNRKPAFDPKLFIFHLKWVDYGRAVLRQEVNRNTVWSSDSLARNYGAHHRYPLNQFIHEGFLAPIDILNRGLVGEFEFSKELLEIERRIVVNDQGDYLMPMDVVKYVAIPERFAAVI